MKSIEQLQSQNSQNSRIELWKTIIEDLPELERRQTQEETEIIVEADRITSAVIKRYGLSPTSIQPQDVHVIPASKWPGGHAFMSREIQGAVIAEQKDLDTFKLGIVHEMFHLKGVNFLPLPLTEATVERLTNEALNVDNDSLVESQIFLGTYTYPQCKELLDQLIEKIAINAPSNSVNHRDVFSFFAKAHLTGAIQYLSFLDNIFGHSTTEKLNTLGDDLVDVEEFVFGLKKV